MQRFLTEREKILSTREMLQQNLLAVIERFEALALQDSTIAALRAKLASVVDQKEAYCWDASSCDGEVQSLKREVDTPKLHL